MKGSPTAASPPLDQRHGAVDAVEIHHGLNFFQVSKILKCFEARIAEPDALAQQLARL